METVVVLGIFSIISIAASWLLIHSNRDTVIIWEQLATQAEGRKALEQVTDDVRRAEVSSVGSFPLVSTEEYSLVFYANIDNDLLRERIHYWIDDTILKKGVLKPSGEPLSYTGVEDVVEIAHSVVNIQKSVPVFLYFDESYSGDGAALEQPVGATDVHVIKVQLELEKDPTDTPVPLHVESTVQVRNLKTN